MIQKLARGAMVALMLIAVAGCEDDNKDNTPPTDISGTWTLNIRSTDDYIAFKDTSLVFTASTNDPTQYDVSWASATPNGTAMFVTNTLTVVMDITQSPTILSLSGTLTARDEMSGGGTIDGYGGLRVASWQATLAQ